MRCYKSPKKQESDLQGTTWTPGGECVEGRPLPVTPPHPQRGQSQGMGTGRWRKSGPPRNAPALLPAWQNRAQGPPSVLGMLEATALETRGPEARPYCSQGSSGHCKGYPQYPHPLSRTVGPRAPRWGFSKPLAWPPSTSGESKSKQALDLGIQNLTSLGSHPLSKESSDFGTSHLQIRVQDGRRKHLHLGELEFRAKSSSHETTPTWTCHSADAQACVTHSLSLSLSFPTAKVSITVAVVMWTGV